MDNQSVDLTPNKGNYTVKFRCSKCGTEFTAEDNLKDAMDSAPVCHEKVCRVTGVFRPDGTEMELPNLNNQ